MELNLYNIYHSKHSLIAIGRDDNNDGKLQFTDDVNDNENIILSGNKSAISYILITPSIQNINQKYVSITFPKSDEGIKEYTETIKYYLKMIIHHADIIINNESYSIVDMADMGSFWAGTDRNNNTYVTKDQQKEWKDWNKPHGMPDIKTIIGLSLIFKKN